MLAGEFTFVLNPSQASTRTYQTWVTIRLTTDGSLLRKCNGHSWSVMGYVSEGETKLFATYEMEKAQARMVAHLCYKAERKCNVPGMGVAWRNATWIRPAVNPATGRKLTAAPSIRDEQPDRDKNVDEMRLRVGGGFMARDGSYNPLLAAKWIGRL